MKFRYKIILSLTLASILFNLIFGFFTIKNELDGEKQRFNDKIFHYNTLIQHMNVMPLWDFDAEKIRSNLDLLFRDPEVVSVSINDITGTINIVQKKIMLNRDGKIFSYNFNIMKGSDKLGEARIEYSNFIYSRRLTVLVIEKISLTLGLIIFNIAAVFLISSYLLKPVDSVVDGLKKIDEGDFDYRMNISSNDEFKQIEIYFNSMVQTLGKEIKSRIDKEEQLVEIHRYLNDVFNSIPSVLITVDRYGTVRQWNSTAEKFTGVKAGDALRQNVWELVPILEKYRDAFNEIIQKNKTGEIRRQYVSEDNDIYINVSISYLVSESGSGAVIRLDDVTEMKRKDEKLTHAQMMDTIGNLAGGLAHDFNNVIAGITGTVSLIKFRMDRGDAVDSEDQKKFLGIIEDSANRAADLTKQILSLSRREEMNFGTADLNRIIKQVAQLCSHTIDKAVEIHPEYYGSEAFVMADPVRLEQVFLNLCINASHSMTVMRAEGEPRGGVLKITIERRSADEFFCNTHDDAFPGVEYWCVSVMDNGIGIEKKDLKKIFEPFFTTKGKGLGSGLGLSMSYNIIKKHTGFIDVYSEPGKGSIFSVYLPVNEQKIKEIVHNSGEVPSGSGLILVIDDEKSMCDMATSMLQTFGYEVIVAEDSGRGIELFTENQKLIKAVLLDMIMPKKSGKELIEIFKEINPSVPVVITSGFGRDEYADKLQEGDVLIFIQKPYSMESLALAIDKAINS